MRAGLKDWHKQLHKAYTMQYVRESDSQLYFYLQFADKQLHEVYNMQYVKSQTVNYTL